MKIMKNVLKYEKFLESKKDDLVELLTKLFTDKPLVKTKSEFYPDEKGAYSLSGIKNYFVSKGKSKDGAEQAVFTLKNDKKVDLKHFELNNPLYGKNPYYYMDMTNEEADKIKSDYSTEVKKLTKSEVDKLKDLKSKAVADRKVPKRSYKTKK
jgi:hypothetical protein